MRSKRTLIILAICLTQFLRINSFAEEEVSDEIYYDSLEYVAQCVEAEAGNQGYIDKAYVADCIFNRYDLGGYDNYYEVINAPGQFSCVSNGSINCVPNESTYTVVAYELEHRRDNEIVFFRTKHYHSCGEPCFKFRDHYFSKMSNDKGGSG